MTFKTDNYFAPFTTLSIRLQIPPTFASLKGKTIHCEGVVVECRGSHGHRVFQVTVAFLNLVPADQKQLAIADKILAESVQSVRDK